MDEDEVTIHGRDYGKLPDAPVPARVFISDRSAGERREALRHIRAYLYGGWDYAGWGSDPCGKMPGTGFLFDGPSDPNDGFGANALVARLATGLHFGHRCEGAS